MESEESNGGTSYGWIFWVIIIILIITAFSKSSDNKFESNSNYSNSYSSSSYEDDGYAWAEDNDISSFEECQDQFGTSYEENECNRYVKENYSGYNTYNGYDCTEDCSGHEAGYNWAEENDISDEYDCDGNSNSFNEGCISYVKENY